MQTDYLAKLRLRVCEVNYLTQEGHLASSLSCLDLLHAIVPRAFAFEELKYVDEPTRPRFILSKGHAALGFYVTLENFGLISSKDLESFGGQESDLGGHPDSTKLPHAYISTGSLGHGLPVGVGAAIALKAKSTENEVIILCGDGEFMEGSIWESVIIATKLKLTNLVVVIDFNSTHLDTQISAKQLKAMFTALDWQVLQINGHSRIEIEKALDSTSKSQPTLIIAATELGFGVKSLQGRKEWHRKNLDSSIFTAIKSEFEAIS